MKVPNGARPISDGIWELELSDRGWDSLDDFIEAAANSRPDREFDDGDYALFIDGDSINARFAHLSLANQNRLNGYAVVIYRGAKHKPLYFTDRDEGINEWNSLCLEMHQPGAQFDDDDMLPPMPMTPPQRLN